MSASNLSKGALADQPGRVGHAILTRMGIEFYPLDPRPDEILIHDIAHSLSLQCRWAGHCSEFYSVAEHSVRVSDYLLETCGPSLALVGLMHDASEAYLVDLPRPIKRHEAFSGPYLAAEAALERAIAERFALSHPWGPEIHHADNVILATEYRDLLPQGRADRYKLRGLPDPLPGRISPVTPRAACATFLQRFQELHGSLS